MRRISAFVLAGLCCSLLPRIARADDPLGSEPRPAVGLEALDRPTGIAEVGFGWLTLPGAAICIARQGAGCSRGDTSFEVDVWLLYRSNRRFAFGAGVLLGLVPTTDPPKEGAQSQRDHSRRYMTLESTARYYPYVGRNVEWWVGITGGVVVVSDSFSAPSQSGPDRELLDPSGVTLRTEGGTLGLATGAAVALTPSFTAGATLRYGQWFLPDKPARDPFESEASLTGSNVVLSLGVNLAYRISL